MEDVFKAITTSALKCPTVMCQLFHTLKEVAITFFPGSFLLFIPIHSFIFFNAIKLIKKHGRLKLFVF